MAANDDPVVILVGVGGATCSGKTTLAKQLRRILPDSVIVHQDDFAPPQETLPIHPVYNVQDWDDPPGAIDWPRFSAFLRTVKRSGAIPPDHRSHDHMNIQQEVAFDSERIRRWRARFQAETGGRNVKWVLVDGFLLYWLKEAVDTLDVRFLLRVPKDVLVQRRIARQGYYTAGTSFPHARSSSLKAPPDAPSPCICVYPAPRYAPADFPDNEEQSSAAEGEMWVDPPYYFDGIVYPAYVKAHKHLFARGDVEHGALVPDPEVGSVVLFDALTMSADDLLERACELLHEHVESRLGTGTGDRGGKEGQGREQVQ